jgi:hypothetical protein
MSRPSPALIVACIALAVALGGTGYAISSLPAGSVGTKQIRNGAVTGAKVKARTLDASKFKKGTLLQGARGEQGPRGEQGAQGNPATPSPLATTEPVTLAATGAYPGTTRTVATFGPVTIRLRCFDRGGGITGIAPEAISTVAGPIVTWPDTTSTGTVLSAGVAQDPPGYVYGPTGAEANATNMRIGIALPDGRAAVTTGLMGWNSLGAGCWMFLA